MKAVKISDNVYWVGAIDWGLRNFHGYATSRGTTYNAYLILDKKITLVDTVKAQFKEEMMTRIRSVIDPKKISYIISNHSEMDHSGSLPEVATEVEPEKILASPMGVKGLKEHFTFDREITEVKTGEELSLGRLKLSFYETNMVHWPDSMMTYLHGEEILFSQDGFGMHLASSERFDDEIDFGILRQETVKYYANILTLYSPIISRTLSSLKDLNLKLRLIAPDHGPIWRKYIDTVFDLYERWTKQLPTKKAVIAFDTMWKSTDKMAKSIADGLSHEGIVVKVMPLAANNRSDIVTELLEAGAFIVGTPTINNQMFPSVADLLYYVKGLKFKNLIGGVFGSYGWSGEGTRQVEDILTDMKIEQVTNPLNIKYVPTKKELEEAFKWGSKIGSELIKYIG